MAICPGGNYETTLHAIKKPPNPVRDWTVALGWWINRFRLDTKRAHPPRRAYSPGGVKGPPAKTLHSGTEPEPLGTN
jgi:hypothetical protein